MANRPDTATEHKVGHHETGHSGRDSYAMFWLNMGLGLLVMYLVMLSMIDGWPDFRNNLNMFYMAVTMWAPMGIFMLATMPTMFPNTKLNAALYVLFVVLTLASFWATRAQVSIGDRQFIRSMIPHHSGAILMCREAKIADPELTALCTEIIKAQRREIEQMQRISARLR